MSSLSIRYPTGHLAVIPVIPQEPLIKVLEAACAKRSLDPRSHKLVHKRKAVNLSIPFRYSGLTNRATLELVPCDQIIETNTGVRLGIRLQDGYRTEWNGSSGSSIWSVLESLALQDQRIAGMLRISSDGLVPTVIYLQNQISGEENLRETTLSSLGIQDSALFQLDKRQPPPSSSRKEYGSKHIEMKSERSATPDSPTPNKKPSQEASPVHEPSSRSRSPVSSTASAAKPSPRVIQQHLPQGETGSNTGASSSFEPFSIFGAARTRSMFDTDVPVRGRPERPMTVGEILGISLEPESRTSSEEAAASAHLREFRFPAETEGQNLMGPEEESQASPVISGPCDREEVIYQRPPPASHETDSEELPPEYFDLTAPELQRLIADLRREAGTDGLLGEQNALKAARARNLKRFRRCIIRFIWTDDVIIQACFYPQEPVSALYDFIRERLVERGTPFDLFTAPPRVVLSNMTETLVNAKLFPLSKVYFAVKNGSSKGREVLIGDLLEKIDTGSVTEAYQVAAKWMPKGQRQTSG